MAEVISLDYFQPVAGCPNCGGQEFYIMLNGYNQNWDAVVGTQCCNCGMIIQWIEATKDD